MPEDLSIALDALLRQKIEDCLRLIACEQLTSGASQETYRLVVETTSGERQFALRRSQPLLDTQSSVGTISLATEARLFELAKNAGIPGPQVHYVLQPADDVGSGFIMDWVSGETLGQRIVRDEALAKVRPRLARECGQILARIHALDWQAADLAAELPQMSPISLVTETWETYRDLNVPVPMIDYCYRWLLDKAPQQCRTTLVHGDFRNGNLIISSDGIAAVLDWELAQIGDPIRDLGWLCVNSWRFGEDALPVGGFGTMDDLLEGYFEASGINVSLAEIKYWQVFGSFWWAMATLQMANAWRTGETPSLERPVIGRRSSEAQMDCVNLLIPGAFDLPQMDASLASGTQLPMPAELLSGVAEYLASDVADQLEGRGKFLAKVAANSLGIAQRELQHGGELAWQEHQRLQKLLHRDAPLDDLRWGLVNSLRDGMPLSSPGLAEHLRQTVAGQLVIDQPRYSALR